MANINKRLADLERKIPQPVPDQMIDTAELAQSLAAEFDELQALGYLTEDWEKTAECPADRRSAACLAEVIMKGEL